MWNTYFHGISTLSNITVASSSSPCDASGCSIGSVATTLSRQTIVMPFRFAGQTP